MKMRGKPPCAGDFPDEDSLAELRSVFQCGDLAVRGAVFRLRSTTRHGISPATRSRAAGDFVFFVCGGKTVDFLWKCGILKM